MQNRTCEALTPVGVTIPVNNSRNKVADLWIEYTTRKISKEELEVLVKRRCIENISNWYFPKKFTFRERWDARAVLGGLIAHNKSMKEYLQSLLNYAGDEAEQGKISAKINDYSAEIYRQEEALREAHKMKAMVTSGVRI